MINKLKGPEMDRLFACILALQNAEECYAFFDDVCTVHELQAMAQRLHTALLLRKGKTYAEIGEETGASTATISRVNRSLQYGSDGYALILDRMGL